MLPSNLEPGLDWAWASARVCRADRTDRVGRAAGLVGWAGWTGRLRVSGVGSWTIRFQLQCTQIELFLLCLALPCYACYALPALLCYACFVLPAMFCSARICLLCYACYACSALICPALL
jgi:hypothetical protein